MAEQNYNGILVVLVLIILYLAKKAYGDKLIYYGRPTCPFCVQFDPVWNEIKMQSYFSTFCAEKINTDTEWGKKKMLNEGHRSVPTIVKVKNGIKEVYNGERTKSAIMTWFDKPSDVSIPTTVPPVNSDNR